MRMTVACPAAMVPDANSRAAAVRHSPADLLTYGEPVWQDGAGNLYAAASFIATQEWLDALDTLPVRPDWDVMDPGPGMINMAGAGRAQNAVRVATEVDADGAIIPILAVKNKITAMPGDDGLAALAAMGLSLIEQDVTSPLGG